MNIALHSAYGPIELLMASVAGGIVSALLYVLIKQAYLIRWTLKVERFPKFGKFMLCMNCEKPWQVTMFASDYFACLIFAILLLCLTFVYNSGIFRLTSALFMLLGFALGVLVWSAITRKSTLFILFCLKWIVDIVTLPIIYLINVLKGISVKIVGRLYEYCSRIILKKYTLYRFARIKKEARYGLLDEYFKEKIK